MSEKLKDFDVANYLDSSEVIAEYLSQILEDGDIDELLSAIDDIARAKGMTQILKEGSQPRFDTVLKVLNNFGIKLQAVA